MFQIAATIGMAIKHGTEYKIPTVSADPATFKTYFSHLPALTAQDVITCTYKENGHPYQKIPFTDGICLDGFFQSEKYFSHCQQQILDAFKLYCPPINKTVSIHVRRGDYLQNQGRFNLVSMEYLDKAITFFYDKGYHTFIVFSDDIPWCKENINKNVFKNCTFFYSENKPELYDMTLMSGCEHHIIGNGSSFSWWGAWLNRNPNKIVVAPEKWFGKDCELDEQDIYCNGWIRL